MKKKARTKKKATKSGAPKKKTSLKKTLKTSKKPVPKKTIKKSAKKSAPKKTKSTGSQKIAKKMTQSTTNSSSLTVGSVAPDFELLATDGSSVRLSDFAGRANVVLYFYPKDDTPGCTVEACAFRDDWARFDGNETVVLGVSPDDIKSHEKFTRKFNLPFPLLADTETRVAQAYGVWVEKNMYGRKYMGVQRATFLIDKNGVLAAVWPKVSVDGHSTEVLREVAKLA